MTARSSFPRSHFSQYARFGIVDTYAYAHAPDFMGARLRCVRKRTLIHVDDSFVRTVTKTGPAPIPFARLTAPAGDWTAGRGLSHNGKRRGSPGALCPPPVAFGATPERRCNLLWLPFGFGAATPRPGQPLVARDLRSPSKDHEDHVAHLTSQSVVPAQRRSVEEQQ